MIYGGDRFRIIESVGLKVEAEDPEEAAAWWAYFENFCDHNRDDAMEHQPKGWWIEMVEERLAFHAGYAAAKGQPWMEFDHE